MDLKQTGKFIQQERKNKGLTQSALAMKIGVSEKTISKWECGKGFPDTTLMLPLCDVLGISVNELLSAKRIETEKEYRKNAEENLVALKSLQERNTRLMLMLEWPIALLSLICLMCCSFVSAFVDMGDIWRIVTITAGLAIFIYGMHFALLIEANAGFYECKKCGHRHIPRYNSVLWAMHVGRTRYMKCPKCGEKSWQQKRIHGE